MNQLTLNAIALSIFAMTLSVLLGPFLNLSPLLPAGLTLLILSVVTLDSFRFQSLGLTLLLDIIAQQFPHYRQRIIHHEAGHFLVAYLLDLPIESYTLSVWEALQQGRQGGIQLAQANPNQSWLKSNIETLCAIWVAGGIAEKLKYGFIQGNEDDLQQLRRTVKGLGLNVALCERQAQTKAQTLIQDHWQSYEALVPYLKERRSIPECYAKIEQFRHPIAQP